jgi:hypothetical protein
MQSADGSWVPPGSHLPGRPPLFHSPPSRRGGTGSSLVRSGSGAGQSLFSPICRCWVDTRRSSASRRSPCRVAEEARAGLEAVDRLAAALAVRVVHRREQVRRPHRGTRRLYRPPPVLGGNPVSRDLDGRGCALIFMVCSDRRKCEHRRSTAIGKHSVNRRNSAGAVAEMGQGCRRASSQSRSSTGSPCSPGCDARASPSHGTGSSQGGRQQEICD